MDVTSVIPKHVDNAYRRSSREVLKDLGVRASDGLSYDEAERRQSLYGPNVIAKAPRYRFVFMFLHRFRDVLVFILLSATVISLMLGFVGDAIIIMVALVIDGVLSFLQVWKTERTLEHLRIRTRDSIIVVRDGVSQSVPSESLVAGDVIEFRAGDKVPADARVISAQGLRVRESILTGESGDVSKSANVLSMKALLSGRFNMVYAGTTVVSGIGIAVVTAIGSSTEMGKIAISLHVRAFLRSPLQRKLQKTGTRIGWFIVAAVALLAVAGLARGDDVMSTGRMAITLVVSAIPEDLVVILTIALTIGVARILKSGGVVRRLGSGETLGSTTVICTDKTGTLTEGNMKAVELNFLQGDVLHPHSAITQEPFHMLALTGLAVANDAHKDGSQTHGCIGTETECASLVFIEEFGLDKQQLHAQWHMRDAIIFDSSWKYRAVLADHPTQSTQYLFVTGAPDVLLEKSSYALNEHNESTLLSSSERYRLLQDIDHLASQGKRVLAIAVRRHLSQSEITHDDVQGLLFLGVLVVEDSIRSDVPDAISQTRAAGVTVKLISGDHAATVRAVAQRIGLRVTDDTAITGMQLQHLSDKELAQSIDSINVFSRVEPLDKQRIIRILQKKGHIVAMTGDGVNDAVALKSADIGVAMGSGTDIAKDASDLILLNNSFTTIVAAIKEGRVMRDNIRKVITFLLSTNAAEVGIFFVSIIAGLPLPLLPAQVLWINLVTDGTSDIALALEPAERDAMQRKPEHPDSTLLGGKLIRHIIFSGTIMTTSTMLLFWYLLYMRFDLSYARTMAFTLLSITSLLSVWSFRSFSRSLFTRASFLQHQWIILSTGFSLALHLIALYVPAVQSFFGTVALTLSDWGIVLLVSIITVAILDLRKQLFPYTEVPAKVQNMVK